jgi:hypothetical protein
MWVVEVLLLSIVSVLVKKAKCSLSFLVSLVPLGSEELGAIQLQMGRDDKADTMAKGYARYSLSDSRGKCYYKDAKTKWTRWQREAVLTQRQNRHDGEGIRKIQFIRLKGQMLRKRRDDKMDTMAKGRPGMVLTITNYF